MTQFCSAVYCMNPAAYVVNGDALCKSCASNEIDADNWCMKHQCVTGEGDICYKCEEEFDNARTLMNLEMSKHPYQLWFVCSSQHLFKCPVDTFDHAKSLYHHLTIGYVTGVRIARMDPEQGCESVLYKFS